MPHIARFTYRQRRIDIVVLLLPRPSPGECFHQFTTRGRRFPSTLVPMSRHFSEALRSHRMTFTGKISSNNFSGIEHERLPVHLTVFLVQQLSRPSCTAPQDGSGLTCCSRGELLCVSHGRFVARQQVSAIHVTIATFIPDSCLGFGCWVSKWCANAIKKITCFDFVTGTLLQRIRKCFGSAEKRS